MKKYNRIVLVANLILVLFLFNKSVLDKEETLKKGQLVLFELRPVDPRSLMQGDYMRLAYKIELNKGVFEEDLRDGYSIVRLNGMGIADKVMSVVSQPQQVAEGRVLLKNNTQDQRSIHFGATSYFFQEGKRERYEKAKYGGVKVDPKGKTILIGLYDKNRQRIE